MLHQVIGTNLVNRDPLLPETIRLLDRILKASTYRDLGEIDGALLDGAMSYRARPEAGLPLVRFHIADADPALLAFTGQDVLGFDVLQSRRGGFRLAWRNDLARAFEGQMQVVSRFVARLPTQDLVVEHVVLPMLVRHRVLALWGWITFGGAREAGDLVARLEGPSVLDRAKRSPLAALPSGEVRRARSGPAEPSALEPAG